MEEAKQIAIVPSPGMGHLIPLAEFSKLLISRFHFLITLILPTTGQKPSHAQLSFLDSLPTPISYTFLPPIDPTHMPDHAAPEVTISLIMARSVPSFRATLGSLAQRGPLVALVTDLFGTDLFDVARDLSVPPYMYFTCSAMCLLTSLHLPRLDQEFSYEYRDMPDPIALPGCVPLHGSDLEDAVQDRSDEAYTWSLHHFKRYNLAEGIFINTYSDLESGALQTLHSEDSNWPLIYPIGPLIQSGHGGNENGSDCLSWLDQHPPRSVLFVSFGSGGTLSSEQFKELANGLEKSGQRFIWVIRSPDDGSSSGSFFNSQSQRDPLTFLPKDFVEKVKDRGLLVPSWAPQMKVLSHDSTGGFLTHCGWNSTLESIMCGVPLIAWPLFAEQKMNAVMLNQGLKVALRPNASKCGLIEADEIAKSVKDLMENEEGKNARIRMMELRDLAKKAISENGDSSRVLGEVVSKWNQLENVMAMCN